MTCGDWFAPSVMWRPANQQCRLTAALAATWLFANLVKAQADLGWMINARTKDDAMLQSALLADGGPGDGGDYRIRAMFDSYKATYYKQYATAEAERAAFDNFANNLAQVVLPANMDYSKPFWLSGNMYTDHTYATFRARYLLKPSSLGSDLRPPPGNQVRFSPAAGKPPAFVDWRVKGKVDYVKDQGTCASCWAYAAAAVTESAFLIRFNLTAAVARVTLSAQQLIDCAVKKYGWGSLGCDGGSTGLALRYINQVYLATEHAYPDTWEDGECYAPADPAKLLPVVQLGGGPVYPERWSELALMQAVAQQPTVIYFCVAEDFVSYAGGIYVPTEDCEDTVNHAMVVVGYHYTGSKSTSYWMVRNSWSAWWGLHGYALVQMTGTPEGPCGMYTYSVQAPLNFTRIIHRPRSPLPPSPRPASPVPSSPAPAHH